jgi:predicted AAA+ superfamily ATPase
VRIDLLDDSQLVSYTHDPTKIMSIVRAMDSGDTLIIDEVQKVPALLSQIHKIMEDDEFPQVQFILTGSSVRKLKETGGDLLAGRAHIYHLHPFLASELGAKFNLESALRYGLLPVIYGFSSASKRIEAYMATYLKEEVKQEGLVRSLESFSRFLETLSFSHSEILNLSNVARESSVKRSTVDGYLSIVEDLLLGYRLSPFKKRNRKNTVDSEKFYYFDVGIFNKLRPQGPLDGGNIIGQALEGLVMQHLYAWVSYRDEGEKVYFWRTQSGNEVDFIIYGAKTFMAIEVKNSSTIQSEFFKGLRSFGEDYPEAKLILLFRGKRKEIHQGIECIPIEQFLKSMWK